ncbi:hypothetical protein QE417_002174 [Mucilaginibacter terrae]|uniref:Uncharacterized protein n=1 Tax=Mucilaginibacter terrae TaxID=1955052 RepID=A0ABU3GVV4_9SPHI|nr:hypothetical protein [Mucilaginibacter terrae]
MMIENTVEGKIVKKIDQIIEHCCGRWAWLNSISY